ncbi:hypothetical protein AOQ84DRAFT_303486 [Glonium stellatum]|uniref:DUF7580 domain-containing protein n=1 Tax=Glonium stellatum TaxID=574774 RepID=A0A8E2ERM0_9PEZI|nr:hypothetical protein AOQ84DRAFT_303486 [Glonium stellatum]
MEAVSLEDILRKSPEIVTVEFQLKVAHRLAIAVLQYHSTPWLHDKWGIQDVYFFNATDLSSDDALETLHFEVRWKNCNVEKQKFVGPMMEERDEKGRVLVSDKTLLRLGVALLELGYSKPLQWLKEREDIDDFAAAQSLSSRVPPLGPRYQQIVQNCLKWSLRKNDQFMQGRHQWAIHIDVVSPLEHMLQSLDIENKALDTGMRVLVEGDQAVNFE